MTKASKPIYRSAKELLTNIGSKYPVGPRFTGMIRPAANDTSISFARTGDCSQWVSLPVEQIADVEFVRWVHCGEDRFPQVHITMRPPETHEGNVFADLATLHQDQVNNIGPPGPSGCYFDWKLNRIVCP
jgi:hypothetical protein